MIDHRHRRSRLRHISALAAAAGDVTAFVVGVGLFWDGSDIDLRNLAVLGVPVFFLVYNLSGMYLPNGQGARASLARSATAGFLAAFLIWLMAVIIGTVTSGPSRDLPLFMGAVFAAGWRIIVRRIERYIEGRQHWLLVTHGGQGTTEEVHLLERISQHQDLNVREVVSFRSDVSDEELQAHLGFVETIVLSPDLNSVAANRFTLIALANDKAVLVIPDLQGLLLHAGTTQRVDDLLVIAIARFQLQNPVRIIKRFLDVAISVIALILLLPVMAAAAIAIRRDSIGPILFRQERTGLEGETFDVIKFRTMVHNAETQTGPVLATVDDPRITRVGTRLRRVRLDELPQLFNVIHGDMSLVGPRPERPELIAELRKTVSGYDLRHRIKPGITGLAQVSTKYATTTQDKLRFDLLYIQRHSLSTDLRILVQTLKVVLTSTAQSKGVAANG